MFKIEKKEYGVKLIFEGFITKDEMTQWVEDSKEFLISAPSKFGVFIDMRKLKALSPDVALISSDQNTMLGQSLAQFPGVDYSGWIVPVQANCFGLQGNFVTV